ncbi:MAG TPA: STAS domain-containing protein [Herpetosiphonaceae bacterium]|nr:STAS domain-containing protein [Herpetosiphonaceae bacterium]
MTQLEIAAEPPRRPALTQPPGTTAACSVTNPRGDGVRDISLLLEPPGADLSRWYDTYDGTVDDTPDWYALRFPREQALNTILWVHGPMVAVGGWWTSLAAEYLDQGGTWRAIPDAVISPGYDFSDDRADRRPFEPFMLRFAPLRARGIRLIGRPGGSVRVTTMRYLAAAMLDADAAGAYLEQLRAPLPRIYGLLPPDLLWDLMASVREITAIAFDVQSSEGLGLDHFLSAEHFRAFNRQDSSVYDAESLYQLIGTHEGWDRFGAEMLNARAEAMASLRPVLQEHHGSMLWIVIPVVINGAAVGTIENRNLIARDRIDADWHAAAPGRLGIDPDRYAAALRQVPIIAADKLAAIVGLLQQIVAFSQQRVHTQIEVAGLRQTVEELAVTVLPVWQGVLSVPLIGDINVRRIEHISATLLGQVSRQHSRFVIVDITGVTVIDAVIAAALGRLAQALGLLGARCFLSGVRPEVALTLVQAGVNLGHARTFASLQAALAVAIDEVRG